MSQHIKDNPKRKIWFWCIIASVLIMIGGITFIIINDPSETEDNVQVKASGNINGHDYVDMGTSVKWATCNLGAKSPTGYGRMFQWSETSPSFIFYGQRRMSESGPNISGLIQYDAATANWGEPWRMPTKEECQELIDSCSWQWIGSGMKITARNGNVLYLPASGYRYGFFRGERNDTGRYWTASGQGLGLASYLYFYENGDGDARVQEYERCLGRVIRPVAK